MGRGGGAGTPPCLDHYLMVSVGNLMVSVVLTSFRGKYIDFQLMFGKWSAFLTAGGPAPSLGHYIMVSVGKRMVSVMLTSLRGKYIHFQLKLLYGMR